jgi:hypothetical protein
VIPQEFPLFAIHSETEAVYLVVGWREMATSYDRLPVLAPVSRPGTVRMTRPDYAAKLIYSPQPRPIFPLPPPADRQTEVIPAVRPTDGRLRP